jgi:hypothetical protein
MFEYGGTDSQCLYVENYYILVLDCSFLVFFLLTNFSIKSALSDMRIATPAYFQFAHTWCIFLKSFLIVYVCLWL